MAEIATSKPFRIALIGGGIGGLCTAISLYHFCSSFSIKISVFEQAAEYKEIGAGIGMGPNASKLLHKYGVGDLLNEVAGNRKGTWFRFCRYDNADEITTISQTEGRVRGIPIARYDMLNVLVKFVRDNGIATLHTNKACRTVKDLGEVAEVAFEDGTTTTVDLVVGCDGIHSKVRANYVADEPRYGGWIAYRAVIPTEKLSWPFQSWASMFLAHGRHVLTFPISQNKSLNVVAFVTKSEKEIPDLAESWTSTCDKADVLKDFDGFHEVTQQLFRLMPERTAKWRINDREPLPQWTFSGGKVVLLGDAAHAMVPHQGAGGGQAVEDGYILGRALSDYFSNQTLPRSSADKGHLGKWMKLYQDVRLPRAQKVAKTSVTAGQVYEMEADFLLGKSYEDCLPLVREDLLNRMKWVWDDDVDDLYDKMRDLLMSQHRDS